MAREILYVSNFAEHVTEDHLRELFGQFGDVDHIEIGDSLRFDVRNALVTMSAEKSATKAMHTLNGTTFEDRYIYISYPTPDPKYYEMGLSAKARQNAEAVCNTLDEHYRKQVRRIHTMMLVCGYSFVEAVLKEAKEIYEGDGMLTLDGSRKRTLGGVFFQLANRYYSPTLYSLIYSRGGKLPGYKKEDDRAFYHLILNPHEDV
ncbi:MAG: hypothetical protein RLP44_05960 [Aggregatilineales bacterium]